MAPLSRSAQKEEELCELKREKIVLFEVNLELYR